tara:strand:+ start:130 stop:498 length:369 start_codon:yes stop_codon:yes gene_type:complete
LLAISFAKRVVSAGLFGTQEAFAVRKQRQARVAQLDRALASEARGCGFDPRRAYHSSLPKSPHFPMLAFNEITDFLTNVFKAAAFSCVIIILIVIGVVLLVLKWTVFIDDKKKDSPENEVEN